ncbi:MAG: FtsX-like permease family protein [Lachnospiraceae bacterium]|nr:FtsX-like permease family protein [Lachnospiraceae bacterium]
MKLNKRYLRSIRANLPFYISASVLTMVTLLMFYLFYIAGVGINRYGDEFFSKYNVEDAAFSTFAEIPDEDIARLEKDYGLTLEKEHFAGVEEENFRVRVFSPNKKIDLYELQSGREPISDDEIIISAGYAEENNVQIGDKYLIHGRQYSVAGTFLRPDYLYMVENLSDDYKNVTTFFLAYMTPEEFENQFGSGSINNKVVYSEAADEAGFRREINEKYFMSDYLSADNNMRITFVHEQADMFVMSSWFILVTFPLLTVALVCILLGRRIRAEQKLIGTLSAMGYEKKKLMRHYSVYAVIPGICGGVLTSVAALLLAKPFGSLGLADYEPMKPRFTLPVWVAVAGVVIPTLIYYIAAMLRVRKLLKEDTVKLLAGQIGNNHRSRRVLSHKKASVKSKFALRQLIGNPGRSFVIFLGIFLGAMIVAFAFSFIDSVKAVGEQAHDEFGSFKYEYILNFLKNGAPEDGEAVLVLPYEDKKSRRFSLMGLDSDASLWNLTTVDGQPADIERGFYISTLCEAIYDIHKGDDFTFRNIATLEEYTVKIDGVIKNGYQSYLISSRKNAADLSGLEKDAYNAVLADRALDYSSEEITEIISDTTYKTQMENMMTAMGALISALMIIGMIVCIAALYAMIDTILSENSHNISMLKVLGLENGRINSMIISSNHILLIPGVVLGIASAYAVMAWYCKEFVEVEHIMIPATLYPKSILYTAIITVLSYVISLLLLRRKVDKMDMIEALKDDRE